MKYFNEINNNLNESNLFISIGRISNLWKKTLWTKIFKLDGFHSWIVVIRFEWCHLILATTFSAFLSNFSFLPVSFFSLSFCVLSSLIFFLIFSRSSLLLTPKSLRPDPLSRLKRLDPLTDLSENKVLKQSIPESVNHRETCEKQNSFLFLQSALV